MEYDKLNRKQRAAGRLKGGNYGYYNDSSCCSDVRMAGRFGNEAAQRQAWEETGVRYMADKNKKMKIARIEKDLSQDQLASIVGVTRQTISMIESGKFNPSLQLCIAICKALDRTLDQLFWEE